MDIYICTHVLTIQKLAFYLKCIMIFLIIVMVFSMFGLKTYTVSSLLKCSPTSIRVICVNI